MGVKRNGEAVIGLDLGGTNMRIAGITRSGEVVRLYRPVPKT